MIVAYVVLRRIASEGRSASGFVSFQVPSKLSVAALLPRKSSSLLRNSSKAAFAAEVNGSEAVSEVGNPMVCNFLG